MFPSGRFQFLQEGREKSSLESGSMDAITICEALHWCDIPTTLTEFHRQLKAGSVLCIMHYSGPYLTNPEAQEIWAKMWLDDLAHAEWEDI
jgi:ubiquinone/menaquinone biosynthesis C-methylase UbiE